MGLLIRLITQLHGTVQSVLQSPTDNSIVITKTISQSMHYAERTLPVRHIVVHSFALPVDQMVARLDKLGVSTHYLIDTTGQVTKLVPEDKVAWHAGASFGAE